MNVFSLPARPHRAEVRRISPVDPPRAHASGPAPYRVLAIGGALLAGTGVLSHDLALTGTIARGIARLLGHGVDVESSIDERGGVDGAVRAVLHRDLSRMDAVVLVLDSGDRHARAGDPAHSVGPLAATLRSRLRPTTGITVVMPPTSGHRPAEDAPALMGAAEQEAPSVRVVRLADRVLVPTAAERYTIWGSLIGASVAAGLVDPIVWTDPTEQLDEKPRSTALRRLRGLDQRREEEFRRIVGFARQAYGARRASLSLIDDASTGYLVRQGFDVPAVPREQSICDLALRSRGGVIVGDAGVDERFRHFPLVASGDVRFYAGYRFDSPEGQPLGVLCVFDPEPRPVLPQDLTILRDFAVSTERRLWDLTRRAARR